MQVTFCCWTVGPDERLAVGYVVMVSSIYGVLYLSGAIV